MRTTGNIITENGIHWYYEQEGNGPHIVLVPDGLGDCKMFDKPMSMIATRGFTVTSFDMPGMSRSADAPPETYEDVTPQKLASYVISICHALKIDKPTFWGCSSGGSTMLALVADYPDRVRNAIAHEVPTYEMPPLLALVNLPDDEIRQAMVHALPMSIGNMEEWNALGEEFHSRIWQNYPRWARGYIRTLGSSFPVNKADLKGKPLDWSIGGDTPSAAFIDNAITATKLDIPFRCIPGRHFPYVTDLEPFVAYVVETTQKYLGN
jgi:pimeloyl-ACP methyl ester carboxylesterase